MDLCSIAGIRIICDNFVCSEFKFRLLSCGVHLQFMRYFVLRSLPFYVVWAVNLSKDLKGSNSARQSSRFTCIALHGASRIYLESEF